MKMIFLKSMFFFYQNRVFAFFQYLYIIKYLTYYKNV